MLRRPEKQSPSPFLASHRKEYVSHEALSVSQRETVEGASRFCGTGPNSRKPDREGSHLACGVSVKSAV
jgi:hypothetical protein